ncbi:MAG TPA: hypothetical protein VJT73_11940 [Polyangiaceae bacterium]|nr:hypothetical protein [Polyangiaceae bacterium]
MAKIGVRDPQTLAVSSEARLGGVAPEKRRFFGGAAARAAPRRETSARGERRASGRVATRSIGAVLMFLACTSDQGAANLPDDGAARGEGPLERPRARSSGQFVCRDGQCIQRYPRLPDDGEWSCEETGGVVVCVGGEAPAGVASPTFDGAWRCGPRDIYGIKTTPASPAPRVCVDVRPEFPDGYARGWRCRYVSAARRICERAPGEHAVGDACDRAAPCLDGLDCVASRCVAPPLVPSCAKDGDCESRRCRFGSCRSGDP